MELAKSKFIKWAGPGYKYSLRVNRHLYEQRDIEKKKILDIGAGNGERSGTFVLFFGATLCNAVDLWDGSGSQRSTFENITYLQKKTLRKHLRVTKKDICEFSTEEKYGFILAHSSLHHIFKSKKRLKKDHDLEKKVIDLFKKIGGWLEANGKFMIFETSRRNWSPIPQYRKRFKTAIDLSTKQDPWGWISALRRAGFKKIYLRYPAPVIFDRCKGIHWLFDNYFMSILTGSTYLIEASNFNN